MAMIIHVLQTNVPFTVKKFFIFHEYSITYFVSILLHMLSLYDDYIRNCYILALLTLYLNFSVAIGVGYSKEFLFLFRCEFFAISSQCFC